MTVQFKEDLNNRKVYIKISQLEELTRRSIRQGFFQLGDDLKDEANRAILKGIKTGRVYVSRGRTGRRRRHRASAPGESHANRTGKLRRSLGYKIGGARTLEFGYGVDKSAPDWGKFVEWGTFKMRPRPTLQNAIKATNRNAEIHVGNQFKKLTR